MTSPTHDHPSRQSAVGLRCCHIQPALIRRGQGSFQELPRALAISSHIQIIGCHQQLQGYLRGNLEFGYALACPADQQVPDKGLCQYNCLLRTNMGNEADMQEDSAAFEEQPRCKCIYATVREWTSTIPSDFVRIIMGIGFK